MLTLVLRLLLMSCLYSFGIVCDGTEANTSLTEYVGTKFDCVKVKKGLVITGEYIKFSEFTKDRGELKNLCTTTDNITSLTILATKRVIIDHDVRMAGIEMYVIAPVWEVIGSKKINLDGQKPPEPHSQDTKPMPQADGTHGNYGVSGNFGGNFVGLGSKFINGESLTISVSGGNGQYGGDGGDGGDGTHGLYADKSHVSIDCILIECTEKGTNIQSLDNLGRQHTFNCVLDHLEYGVSKKCSFIVKGEKGRPSGNGGNSGAGGKPGIAGNILIFDLGVKSGIKKVNNTGKAGKNGTPGNPGEPGSNGPDVKYCIKSIVVKWENFCLEYIPNPMENGKHGTVGSKADKVKPSKELDSSMVASIIVEYRGLLMENLNLSDTNDFYVQFYTKIGKNKEILSMYDTLALVNELRMLEKQFNSLHKRLNFLPLYQSLLHRTAEYSKQSNSKAKTSLEHKKVLTYLYTTILGREYNLKDRSESNLIIDIDKYLELVQNSIQKYKESTRINAIEKIKEDFKETIELKTEEAHDAIKNVIMPELENVLKENNRNVDAVIGKIMQMEGESKKNVEKIGSAMEEFRGNIFPMMLLDTYSLATQMLGAVPKIGPVISAAGSELAKAIGENFQLEKNPKIQQAREIPANIKNAGKPFEDFKNKSVEELRALIEFSLKHLRQSDDDESDLIVDIKSIGNKLKDVKDLKGIYLLREHLNEVLKRKYDQSLKKRKKRTLTFLDYLRRNQPLKIRQTIGHRETRLTSENKINKKVAEVVLMVACGPCFFFYNKWKQSNKVLDKFNEAINKEREFLDKLMNYENSIRKDMGPALDMMNDDILSVTKSLGSQSRVSLGITKWQIQSKLKSMQVSVISMTKGINMSDLFTNTFSKIDDAISTLVQVYDQIQSQQEDQNWANYIADINSAGSRSIKVSDKKLNKALDFLNVVLQSNTVIQQYQIAIDSYKQFVFPFALLYLKELVLPDNLNYGENLQELVIKAETQIIHIKEKLDIYRSTAKKIDSYLGKGQFNSKYRSTKPFFVWSYKRYSQTISALLYGKKVMLFADVKESMSRYDAVKFTEMEFNFKVSDKKKQSVIKKLLKSFTLHAFHMGNSYFRTNDQYFLFTTGKNDFWYSLEKDDDGIPLTMSDVHAKVKHGDSMLSPYATWSLQLTHFSELNPQAFKELQKYKKEVSVELIGRGHFVYKDKLDTDLELDQFYTPLYKINQTKP